jgi:hypothetical protein
MRGMDRRLGLVLVSVFSLGAEAARVSPCPKQYEEAVGLRPLKKPQLLIEGQAVREGMILDIGGEAYRHTGKVDSVTGRLEVVPIGGGDAIYVQPADKMLRHGIYGAGDYPIELIHPGVQVQPGRINRDSLAFRQWRFHTPEQIPDEAFNTHYMTREQLERSLAEKAGYASAHAEVVKPADLAAPTTSLCAACGARLQAAAQGPAFMAMPASKYVTLLKAPEVLAKAVEIDGTGAKFLAKAGVDPTLTLSKVQSMASEASGGLSHKYVMDDTGQVFLFSAADQRRIMDRLGMPASSGLTHPQLATLAMSELPAGRKIVGIGYFNTALEAGRPIIKADGPEEFNHTLNADGLDFPQYFRDYVGLAAP